MEVKTVLNHEQQHHMKFVGLALAMHARERERECVCVLRVCVLRVCVCVRRSRMLSQKRIRVEFKEGWRSVKAKREQAGDNLQPEARSSRPPPFPAAPQAAPSLCEADAANSDSTRQHFLEGPFRVLTAPYHDDDAARWHCVCRAAAQQSVSHCPAARTRPTTLRSLNEYIQNMQNMGCGEVVGQPHRTRKPVLLRTGMRCTLSPSSSCILQMSSAERSIR